MKEIEYLIKKIYFDKNQIMTGIFYKSQPTSISGLKMTTKPVSTLLPLKFISGKIKIVGVTTLTSLDNKNLKEIGYNKSVKNLIIHQAKLAKKAKLDAIVSSPKEVKYVRKFFKKEIITPGVRFNENKQDQKRTMHPSKIKSDWLVCGRIITKGNIKNNLKKLIQYLN